MKQILIIININQRYIFEDGKIERMLTENGYVKDDIQYFYFKDYQGNNRAIADSNGNIENLTAYYPYGTPFGAFSGNDPYKYNGKELDTMNGLNLYDFAARQQDPTLGIFTSQDPLAGDYPAISPYAYCAANPVMLIDPTGKEPGDLFHSINSAAIDFGRVYNGRSILNNHEFSSSIYLTKNKKYSYSVPNEGNDKNSVTNSLGPKGNKQVAIIHTHGAYSNGRYNDNDFSGNSKDNQNVNDIETDIGAYNNINTIGYVSTPNGSLLKYDSSTGEVELVIDTMPSDPNDPNRKNNINPDGTIAPSYDLIIYTPVLPIVTN